MVRRFLSPLLLIAVIAALLPTAAVRPVAAAAGNSDFGVNSHIGATYDVAATSRPLDIMAEISAGWAREEFVWYRIERAPGQFDWTFYDRAIPQLAARGVKIIGLLNTAPAWATPFGGDRDGQPSFYPPDPQRFAQFAAAAVTRYRNHIKHWEVWNEPENQLYWQSGPNPAEYAALLKAAYPAIKGADQGATVLSAGVVPTHIDFIRALSDNGAWGSFDVLAIHPYVDPFGPEEGQIGSGDVAAVKSLVARLGNKPIWATEFGWSTGPASRDPSGVDEETQANYLIRSSALLRAAGVEKVLWFRLKDTEVRNGSPFNQYGLLRYAGGITDLSQPRPSLAAFRTLNEQLAGAAPVGTIDLGGQSVLFDFENFGTWRRGDQANGTFGASGEVRRSGATSGALQYNFPSGGNDFVVFTPRPPIDISGSPAQLGLWVWGDSSGHALKVWLRDSQGETLQFRLGFIGGAGWSFLSTPINGQVEEFNRISGGGNLRLDFPASVVALVLDDEPDGRVSAGTIYLDDLTAVSGPDAYGVRFARGGGAVDVIWATNGGRVSIATTSAQGSIVDRNGGTAAVRPDGGRFTIDVGPAPIFLTHVPPGNLPAPPPSEAVPPPAAPAPAPVSGPCRTFAETGHQVCGRILEYWNQNGGLPVFGFPITPQFTEQVEGKPLQVQVFERNRLELHPENQRPYDVLLGRLGADRLAASGRDWNAFPKADPSAPFYFAATGQAIAPEFRAYWSANGLEFDGRPGKSPDESLALFGLPLSPAIMETNPTDGKQYLTQHFERARFEYHPENAGTPYVVLLGLLGREVTGIR